MLGLAENEIGALVTVLLSVAVGIGLGQWKNYRRNRKRR